MRRTTLLAGALLPLFLALPALAQDKDDPFDNLFGERQDGADDEELSDDPLPRALQLLSRGKHNAAEVELKLLLEEDEEDEEVLWALGQLYLKTGRIADAEKITATLKEVQPDQPPAHLLAGRIAERKGDVTSALARYKTAATFAARQSGPVALESHVRHAELLWEIDAKVAAKALNRVLAYYQQKSDLGSAEFVWVARACRLVDYFPDLKAEYSRGMSEYARRMIDQALALDKQFVPAHLEAGRLALDTYDTPLAKKSFERALSVDPNNAEARVGLAAALLASYYAGQGKFGDAAGNLQKALSIDPGYAPAHAMLAAKEVTDGNFEQALERLETGLRAWPGEVDLMAVKASVFLLRGDKPGFAKVEKQVLEARPRCARFYETVADLVSMKFRYAEARNMARRALAVNPGYHRVLSILGVNLTRTGEEEEGRRILKKAFEADPFNVYIFNHLQLWDRLDEHYTVVQAEGFTLRVHKDELKVTTPYMLELLNEAKARFTTKYGKLPDRVLVELFPQHNDFSARSVGLPGIPALGVCFGNVVTVLSAKEKKAVGSHSWGRTLWHEFAHVATLTVTGNRISRWFSEGLSVYEEPRGRKTWRREYDAEIMTLMQRGLLLPIARLDEGFTKPKYPNQVMMSYYQAGMICEFIDARWGFAKIKALLDCYAAGKDTASGVREVFEMEPEAFDALFYAFLERRYANYAWLPPPSLEDRQALARQLEGAPWDVGARGALARAYALHGQSTDAEYHAGLALKHAEAAAEAWGSLAPGEARLGLPGRQQLASARAASVRAGAGDAHLALGLVAQRKGKLSKALRRMQRALELGTRDVVLAHKVIGTVHRVRKRWPEAIAAYETAARLSPPSADFHRFLHACRKAAKDEEGAMAELRKVCMTDSNDAPSRMAYAEWAVAKDRWADVADVLDDINMIDPFLPKAHLMLADGLRRTALGKKDKLERALREYEMALVLEVDYRAGAYFGQAACLDALGREPKRALDLAIKALDDDPDHAEARKLKERLQAAQGAGDKK